MQARLTAILARPLRHGAVEAHARARAIVVDRVFGRRERVQVFRCQVFLRRLRTGQHAQRPMIGNGRSICLGECATFLRATMLRELQHIARAQRAAIVPAEFAVDKGRRAAHDLRHLDATRHEQVGAHTRPGRTQFQHVARYGVHYAVGRHGLAVELRLHIGTREAEGHGRTEAVAAAAHGHLDARRIRVIAEQAVADAEAVVIHGTAGRHADRPIAEHAFSVLHRALDAAVEHLQCRLLGVETVEHLREEPALLVVRRGKKRGEIGDVRRDAVDLRLRQHLLHGRYGRLTRILMHDEFREHGVVERRDRNMRLEPRLDTCPRREMTVIDAAAAGAEIVRAVLGVDAHLDGVPLRLADLARKIRKLARGLAHHPLHEVDAHDLLGDAMLDLQARIDLQEVEPLRRFIVEEFHCARAAIGCRMREAHGRLIHLLPRGVAQMRCR